MILESRGTCPHCGQQQILNHAESLTQDQLDKVQFTEFRGDTIKLTRSRDNVAITRIHKKQVKM